MAGAAFEEQTRLDTFDYRIGIFGLALEAWSILQRCKIQYVLTYLPNLRDNQVSNSR
jgi:hypothetical protein